MTKTSYHGGGVCAADQANLRPLLQWGQGMCGAEPGWEEEFSVSFLLCRFVSLSLMRLSSKVATPRECCIA